MQNKTFFLSKAAKKSKKEGIRLRNLQQVVFQVANHCNKFGKHFEKPSPVMQEISFVLSLAYCFTIVYCRYD